MTKAGTISAIKNANIDPLSTPIKLYRIPFTIPKESVPAIIPTNPGIGKITTCKNCIKINIIIRYYIHIFCRVTN